MDKSKAKISNNEQVVRSLERLLARKMQIKAELAELTEASKSISKQFDEISSKQKDAEALRESEDIYSKQMSFIERREATLFSELVDVNALTRSIPARRLKNLVDPDMVHRAVLDAGLAAKFPKSRLRNVLLEASKGCVTDCRVCVTSCQSECTFGCTSDCTYNCTSGCSSGCPLGCPNGCRATTVTGPYKQLANLNHDERTMSRKAIKKMVSKKYGVKGVTKIDWD